MFSFYKIYFNEAPASLLFPKETSKVSLRAGYLLPLLRRERNPSEADISSHSSASLRSRSSAKGDKPHGFTLIELILVVAMILILTTMSTSFYSRFINQNSVINASDQLVMQLRKAQMYAMMGKQNSNWGVGYSSNTMTLYKGSTFTGHTTEFDENFTVPTSVTITGLSDVNFTKTTGATGTQSITISDQNGNSSAVNVNSLGTVNKP
jgi:prepilin-type N-terminal cleavage/methylation domain-containing protein